VLLVHLELIGSLVVAVVAVMQVGVLVVDQVDLMQEQDQGVLVQLMMAIQRLKTLDLVVEEEETVLKDPTVVPVS